MIMKEIIAILYSLECIINLSEHYVINIQILPLHHGTKIFVLVAQPEDHPRRYMLYLLALLRTHMLSDH